MVPPVHDSTSGFESIVGETGSCAKLRVAASNSVNAANQTSLLSQQLIVCCVIKNSFPSTGWGRRGAVCRVCVSPERFLSDIAHAATSRDLCAAPDRRDCNGLCPAGTSRTFV